MANPTIFDNMKNVIIVLTLSSMISTGFFFTISKTVFVLDKLEEITDNKKSIDTIKTNLSSCECFRPPLTQYQKFQKMIEMYDMERIKGFKSKKKTLSIIPDGGVLDKPTNIDLETLLRDPKN